MNKIKISIVIGLLLLVTGCSQHRNANNLMREATGAINKEYKTSNGSLILKYDLNNSRSTCLHSASYGKIINNPKVNKRYIAQIHHQKLSRSHIVKNAQEKLLAMHKLAYKLRKKYRLPLRLIAINSSSTGNEFYGARAISARLNAYARQFDNMPTFLPEYKPMVTSPFGMRRHPITGQITMHNGLDLAGRNNSTVVYAAGKGTVTFAGRKNGYGNIVMIKHGYNLESKYAHLRQISVKTGEKVITGQQLGRQGATGNVTNEHLHFEILLNNQALDPVDFLSLNLNCY